MDILAAMNDRNLFEPWFAGSSWDGWRTILKAAYALPMSDEERAFFRSVAEREPPRKRVRELWVVAGRRGGKDSIASLIAAHAGALFDPQQGRLRPGERALCLALATDRDQAKIVLNYCRSYFEKVPLLGAMVTNNVANGFVPCSRLASWVERPCCLADLFGLDRPKDAAAKALDQGREESAFAVGLLITQSGFVEGADRLFAIGMTFPKRRFIPGAELFGLALVASSKAFSYALPGNGTDSVVDGAAELDGEGHGLSASRSAFTSSASKNIVFPRTWQAPISRAFRRTVRSDKPRSSANWRGETATALIPCQGVRGERRTYRR